MIRNEKSYKMNYVVYYEYMTYENTCGASAQQADRVELVSSSVLSRVINWELKWIAAGRKHLSRAVTPPCGHVINVF